jgi:hypothetical protein
MAGEFFYFSRYFIMMKAVIRKAYPKMHHRRDYSGKDKLNPVRIRGHFWVNISAAFEQ